MKYNQTYKLAPSARLLALTVLSMLSVAKATSQEVVPPPSDAQSTIDLNTSVSDNGELDLASGESEQVEFLTRGPLHEAFAEPYSGVPTPAPVIDRMPPEPINELPPDHRPEGTNVSWIPGYWSWDEERNDFLWVSGVWRNSPPGQRWVPGYWQTQAEGNRWISGFWAADDAAEVVYLPIPPDSLEEGPSE